MIFLAKIFIQKSRGRWEIKDEITGVFCCLNALFYITFRGYFMAGSRLGFTQCVIVD